MLTRENEDDRPLENLWAAGETACASVHGANRLGANSLLEVVVFGKAIADQIDCITKPGERHEDLSPVRKIIRKYLKTFFINILVRKSIANLTEFVLIYFYLLKIKNLFY